MTVRVMERSDEWFCLSHTYTWHCDIHVHMSVLAGNKSPGVSRIPGPSGIPAPGSSQLRRPSGGASSSTSPKLRQSKLATPLPPRGGRRSPPSPLPLLAKEEHMHSSQRPKSQSRWGKEGGFYHKINIILYLYRSCLIRTSLALWHSAIISLLGERSAPTSACSNNMKLSTC